MDDLFSAADSAAAESAAVGRFRALVAPVAADAGSVVRDAGALAIAEAVYRAYGRLEASGGLGRAELAAACRGVCAPDEFEARFNVFVQLGMLQPYLDKQHQQRYIFNPTSAAGLLVLDRVSRRGGIDELFNLLDRTQQSLEAGTATRAGLLEDLASAQGMLAIAADYLARLVDTSTIDVLLAERPNHVQDGLMQRVSRLAVVVQDRFADIDTGAVVRLAQRYIDAQLRFHDRLVEHGAAVRDYSLLDPEQYLTAARARGLGELAQALAGVVFDPAPLHLEPEAVIAAVEGFVPRRPAPPRPVRREDGPAGLDPWLRIEQAERDRRERRARRADLALDGEPVRDLSGYLRNAGWPGAARAVIDLLLLASDPDGPIDAAPTDELLVDRAAPVTHLSPLIVTRRPGAPADLAAMEAPAGAGAVL
jgi:hypothetical protein